MKVGSKNSIGAQPATFDIGLIVDKQVTGAWESENGAVGSRLL